MWSFDHDACSQARASSQTEHRAGYQLSTYVAQIRAIEHAMRDTRFVSLALPVLVKDESACSLQNSQSTLLGPGATTGGFLQWKQANERGILRSAVSAVAIHAQT